jgi:hypothetical protein
LQTASVNLRSAGLGPERQMTNSRKLAELAGYAERS